jgi:hypothetical protein
MLLQFSSQKPRIHNQIPKTKNQWPKKSQITKAKYKTLATNKAFCFFGARCYI